MPTGRVRFFDADKGFGFITKDGGGDVFVRSGVLPKGVAALKPGQKVEFGVIERLIEVPPSLSKASRKKAQDMAVIIEDLIKMLDALGNGYRHGRYPDDKHGAKIAAVLRRVADELEL